MFSFIHKWHKKIGIFSAIFVIFLASSGMVLNHSQQFHLNSKYIQTDWLLDLYQIKPTNDPLAYNVNEAWAVQIGERLYFNENEIDKDIKELKGLINIGGLYVVAYDGQLTLLTPEEEVVETLSGAAGVPAGMRAIGYDDQNNVIIKAAHGYYQVNLDELEWEEFDYLEAKWSKTALIPEKLENTLLKKYRGTGLTLERVLLDFHSGRIVGQWGVYLVDIMAALFLILAFSGVWMWFKKK